MPRPEGVLGPGPPQVEEFAAALRLLRAKAGEPGYRELAHKAHFSATTLSDAAGGRRLPTLAVALAYVDACGGDPAEWAEKWRLASASVSHAPADGPAEEEEVPYQGLAAYGPDRAAWYFGRDDLVSDLVGRLADRRLVAVFGASGSGKSSLLCAGLLPAVTGAAGGRARPGARRGAEVRGLVLTPGPDPVGELAITLASVLSVPAGALRADLAADAGHLHLAVRQALAGRPYDAELWLVVDQFEEIFTLCQDEHTRAGFVAALLAATRAPGSRLRVVLGVRADFYGRCAEPPDLAEALADAQVLIGPMTAPQVRDAVVRPAERAGAMVEGALVSTIVAEVAGRAGALPMASHVLLEAWRRRRGSTVTLSGYEAAGGVRGAVAQTAERIWQDLGEEECRALRHALLRMVEIGEGDGAVTARRADRAEFDAGDPVTSGVLEKLAAARLVTLDERTVRLAHEALPAKWPRLRDWVDEDRDGMAVHRRITHAAEVWRSMDRDPDGLYRGVALTRARDWAAGHPGRLTGMEQEFLDAARLAHRRAAVRRRRRIRLSMGVLAAATAVVTVLALLAVAQTGRARDERDLARQRQLIASARARLDRDPQLAFLLSRQAYRMRPDAQAETVLRQSTLNWRVIAQHQVFVPRLKTAAITADGRAAVAATPDGQPWLWRAGGGPPVALAGAGTDVYDVAISGDGRHVASSHGDGTVRIWDVAATGGPSRILSGQHGIVHDIAFSPDGHHLAGADDAGAVWIWDLTGHAAPRVLERGGTSDVIASAVAFAPDGGRLAAIGGENDPIRVWNLKHASARPVALGGSTGAAEALLFSPDGRRVAATVDGTLRIWRASGGGPFELGEPRGVTPLAFSPDGHRLFTGDSYGVLAVWATGRRSDPLQLHGHAGGVRAATLMRDGHLVSVGEDGTVRTWDVGGPYDPTVVHPHKGLVHVARFSPDGRYVASGGYDGSVRVWPATGAGTPRVLPGHEGMVLDAEFAPDDVHLATLDTSGAVQIWNWHTGRREAAFTVKAATRLAYSTAGDRLLASGPGGVTVRAAAGTAARTATMAGPARAGAAFSPDGTRVVAGAEDGTVRVYRSSDGRPLLTFRGHDGPVAGVAYSPDGTHIASLGVDGTIRIWAADGGRPPEALSAAGQGTRVVYSPDGGRLALLGGDELTGIQLWPAEAGIEPVTLRRLGARPLGFAFDRTGDRVATADADGAVRIWSCEVCGSTAQTLRAADTRATRPFTPDERRAFLIGG